MVVVRADSPVRTVADLKGQTVAVGAVDSPQATLIPLAHLRSTSLQPDQDVTVRRFDVGVGLHGDHIGGERDAGIDGRRGRGGVHDRREPPVVRPGGHAARRRNPGAHPDRPIRPLQHDRGRYRAAGPGDSVRRTAAVDIRRRRRGPAVTGPGRPDRVARRPRHRVRGVGDRRRRDRFL
ncbi:MAG: phosphate/phosphite/phosphonate ABC transporter substrate-binding protein [Actinobacteria bacterium]|nr:phosphate/phosphite/phosphonate ABC transporter substrate-binding protein [Actinomycetota bacterium]